MADFEREFRRLDPRWVLRKLYRRPESKYWYGHLRDERTGKVYWRSTGETSKRKAEEAMLAWKRELEARESEESRAIRFDVAFEEYLSLKHVRERTLDDYTRTFKAVFKPRFGDKLVMEIEIKDVEHFLKSLDCDEHHVSPRTRQKYLTELRAFFTWSRRREYLKKDPTDGVKVGRVTKKTGAALTLDQARALLLSCQKPTKVIVEYSNRESAEQEFQAPPYLFLSILIALHTGMRRGNITRLRWAQLELDRRRIFIQGDEMKSHNDFETAIHPELAEVLTEVLRKNSKIRPNDFVLGEELDEIRKSFKTALKKAKLPDIRWHDLRHTFATWVGKKAPFVIYQALLGHSPGSVSERYFHPPFEDLQRVIDSMPRLLSDKQQQIETQVS